MTNIYQLFPRVFGNKSVHNVFNGTIESNGCGKFNDINEKAIDALKELGITHIWLTGIIRHAKLTDYSVFKIPSSHPAVVKGRAGSPYAIKDYYDVDPDLAINVPNRLVEFEQLIERIHSAGLKVIIDFVPNHLAREYKSIAKPLGVSDVGENDMTWMSFSPDNNFYYLPGQSFIPPQRAESLYNSETTYTEQPAKVTGNDCFTATPGINDWFETIKLNYGVDFGNAMEQHFDPIPDTWHKMLHILKFWAEKGVDGFRSDMAEMVPVAFWRWVISELKSEFNDLLMIAEIYQAGLYHDFINAGFDYLYDKVGLYNRLTDVTLHGHSAESISSCWKMTENINEKMLRFMENHDEVRLSSQYFLNDPGKALPAVAVSALMHSCAFMIYNGQENGEKAEGAVGFSGDDGRTSIFDYCHMPQHQRWMNNGKFDGGRLLLEQKLLREKYKKLLRMRLELPAFREGKFYDLMWANPWYTEFDPRFVFAFLRFTEKQILLVVVNFHPAENRKMRVKIPQDAIQLSRIDDSSEGLWKAANLMKTEEVIPFLIEELPTVGIHLSIGPLQTGVYELSQQK
ncbi:MAG: alpha-amylase family protein [Bacteroidales bacterium]|nr:alpha-amylase family protein [Bacteroidales bacterium]